jgi:ABC-type dipeptide/oligopeptide/nickel transport system permease component
MSDFWQFLGRRLLAIPLTLVVITAVLFAMILQAPVEDRAALYLPPRLPSRITAEDYQRIIENIIAEQGLDDPFGVQYTRWLFRLVQGDWGYSPVYNDDVLAILLRHTPVTLELTFYSLLFFIPLGLIAGVVSGWRAYGRVDNYLRLTAFIGAAIPPFILGFFLLSIFYVGLHWFPPGRSDILDIRLSSSTFVNYTGFLTVDGLLNGRLDVTIDALRHLVLPVIALSLANWAILSRITRAAMIEEKDQDYVTSARARGLKTRTIVWRHTFRNALTPALTSTMLSVAAIITGVFVIEAIFNRRGLSYLVVNGMADAPDAPLALGFAVYSVLLVVPLMLLLDILRGIVDPRVRENGNR